MSKESRTQFMKEKVTFSRIEIIFMVVMVALVVVGGITVVSITTRNQNVLNIKRETDSIISAAKNAYASFLISGKTENIVASEDGTSKGMCITIKGLYENDFLIKDYKDWDGYVVIEESNTKRYNYSVWITDKKYVINGYDSNKISDLTLKNGITKYNRDKFTSKVETSFTGTGGDKGGTGSSDGRTLKRYEAKCINEKIE
jgi:hypothetical protein